jgi:serine/threonine protein phosphatase PrpC
MFSRLAPNLTKTAKFSSFNRQKPINSITQLSNSQSTASLALFAPSVRSFFSGPNFSTQNSSNSSASKLPAILLTTAGCVALAIYSEMSSQQEFAHSLSFFGGKTALPSVISGGCNTPIDLNSSADAQRFNGRPNLDLSQVKLLKTHEIDKLISSEEKKFSMERGRIREIHTNLYRANYAIEDSFCILPWLAADSGCLLGVFDGHSGSAASFFAKNELLHYLQAYKSNGWTQKLLDPLPFLQADNHFLEFSLADNRINDALSGACINVVQISGDNVVCANAGDCRAIIGRRRVNSASNSVEYEAVELSKDHQIDTNPGERERLLSEHQDELDIIKRNRVKGRLQPTRGLGDGFYKDKRLFNMKPHNYTKWTPPYTTIHPDIRQFQLRGDEEFMILSSDGLFQDLDSQTVVESLGNWVENKENQRISASSHLIKKALLTASESEIGRRSGGENVNLSWIVGLDPGTRRLVHDDLSVLVVFFDHSGKFENDHRKEGSQVFTPPTLARAVAANKQQQQTAAQHHSIQSKL